MYFRLAFILLLIIHFTSVNYAQRVECFVLKAPEKPFYDIKKIGVLEFNCITNNRLNKLMTDYMVADLVDQYRGIYDKKAQFFGIQTGKEGKTFVKGVKTDFYQVVERDQVQKVLREQRFSLSGALDESSAAEVGKILGLDVIIMGNVSYTHITEKGSSILGIATNTKSTCLKRTVTANGTMKIISVETAQVVGTKSAQASFYDNKCDDQRSGLKSVVQLAEMCMKKLAREFSDYFTPGYELIVYNLERVKLKKFKQRAREAVEYVKNGDLDRAFPIAYAMYEADSYNPKIAYNLGALYEMVGAYEQALEFYNIAYEIDFTNSKYKDAIERAKKGILLAAYLDGIGRPIQPYSFTGDSDALGDRVQMKGNSADRIPVYALPNKKSEVIAKIPGGIELKLIGKSGEFYKVQLRGNKTGFVHSGDIK